MTPYQRIVLRLLVACFEKLLQVPGVATYDEDDELLAEATKLLS